MKNFVILIIMDNYYLIFQNKKYDIEQKNYYFDVLLKINDKDYISCIN